MHPQQPQSAVPNSDNNKQEDLIHPHPQTALAVVQRLERERLGLMVDLGRKDQDLDSNK